VTVSDLAAAAAVCGAIKAREGMKAAALVHDDFRLTPKGHVSELLTAVSAKRQQLIAKKLVLSDRKLEFDAKLSLAKAAEAAAEKAVADAGSKATKEQRVALDNAQREVAEATRGSTGAAIKIGLIESVVAAVDSFTSAIRVIPAGGRRSPLATAALFDRLHCEDSQSSPDGCFTHMLLVKSQSGQAQQLVDNQPFWFEDKFSTVVDLSVTYMLIESKSSSLLAAGTVTGTAKAFGKVGGEFGVTYQNPP
jgi:hypothetical protein